MQSPGLPSLSEEIEMHIFDLETLTEVGSPLRSHKAYTLFPECFVIFLDVNSHYVARSVRVVESWSSLRPCVIIFIFSCCLKIISLYNKVKCSSFLYFEKDLAYLPSQQNASSSFPHSFPAKSTNHKFHIF